MSKNIDELEYLIDAIKSLPGLGKKTATKWAYFLLDQDEQYINEFTNRIKVAHTYIKRCEKCFNFSISKICSICSDINRNNNQLCIVSTVEDLRRIEDSNNYNGLYFILNGEINIRNRDFVPKGILKLDEYISNNRNITEVIIATNFTINGEITSKKIIEILNNYNLRVYRLGFGLPLNSALDYADDETIKYAFINKNIIKG